MVAAGARFRRRARAAGQARARGGRSAVVPAGAESLARARRGVTAGLYVLGGAAMALASGSRRATRTVDALSEPHGIGHDEALAVAAEPGLPRWYLNEQASSYLAPGVATSPR